VLADFGDGSPFEPPALTGSLATVSPGLRTIVSGGELGFAWQDLAGEPVLVVGGRQGGPPDLFFVFPADPVEAALAQLRAGLLAGGAVAIGIALLVAWVIARWLLRPVAEAGRAARRIAGGDLSARVPERGRDEVGRWAIEFNRMADSLEATIARLETSQQQNREFVADVAHELRTPLTALQGEVDVALKRDRPAAEYRETLEVVRDGLHHMTEITENLMVLVRAQERSSEKMISEVPLAPLIDTVFEHARPLAVQRGITLSSSGSRGSSCTATDASTPASSRTWWPTRCTTTATSAPSSSARATWRPHSTSGPPTASSSA
jgi:two-component system sensor histidine kinase MtrB